MNNISWELIGKVHVAGMVLGILVFLGFIAMLFLLDLFNRRKDHEKK